MKRIALLLMIIIAVALIEFTSLVHPIERVILFVTGALFRTVNNAGGQLTVQPDKVRTLLYSDEVAELRKQLDYRQRSTANLISASLSGYATDPTRSQLLINRGSHDGIMKGAPVVAGNGILFGMVLEVSSEKSIIMPLDDPRNSILVRVLRDGEDIHGIARGRFNVGVDLTFVPITEELHVGDIVVTSGIQESVPAGLVLGTITEVRKNQQDLFQSAILDTPYADYPPSDVLVIIGYEAH